MLHYVRNIILVAFRAAHPDTLEVDEARIVDFDQGLFEIFDMEARSQARDSGIPATKFNLSMLVVFATRSSAQLVRTRVRHAVRFFLSAQPRP